MKFNKKGQGALEYLLLIGGAVLIAVIVIALLVGMGSQNSENSKARNEEAMAATNVPTPSVVNSVDCMTDGRFAINWTAVHKAGNDYNLIIDNVEVAANPVIITSSTNPIISSANSCVSDTNAVAIKTTNNGISVLSAPVVVN